MYAAAGGASLAGRKARQHGRQPAPPSPGHSPPHPAPTGVRAYSCQHWESRLVVPPRPFSAAPSEHSCDAVEVYMYAAAVLVAQPGAQHGRRRRRCRWAAAALARAARRGAAPCSATTPAPGATSAASGTGTTGYGTRRTARHRIRTGRRRGRAGSRGGWHGCCTPDSARSPSASSSTSLALATRVSKRQPCVWWALRSSSLGWRVVCCELPSVYSPSHAADGGPTTRRAEDCLDAEKARRCLWRGARGLVPRSARQRDGWTHHPATCPAYPAGKKTNDSGGTEPPPPPLQSPTWLYPRNPPPRLLPKDHRQGTSPSQEQQLRASWYSAPLSYAPNQAINPNRVLSDSNVDS